jgi:mannitol-specific phosphotransferase system IIBC component
MGSSTMAVSMVKKLVKAKGLDIQVLHTPVNRLPADADLVIVHAGLANRARKVQPDKVILKITNFLDQGFYSRIVDSLALGEEIDDGE